MSWVAKLEKKAEDVPYLGLWLVAFLKMTDSMKDFLKSPFTNPKG